MNTPLYSALCAFSDSAPLRLAMPGHKGVGSGRFADIISIDFTELPPTGNLYESQGPVVAAEELAASFASAGDAMFFSCGSTQGIYTAIAAAVGMGGEMILDRGCHKSVYQAMGLLDITPHYIYHDTLPGTNLSGPVSPQAVEEALLAFPHAKAVFLTSPTYYGVISPISEIAEVCHRHGAFLLVDEAHGAHFPAVGIPSAVSLGADLAVVSTHKTWPALGSSSILYIGKDAPFAKSHLKELSALFGTTSPSWPILASIDYARAQLEGQSGADYRACAMNTAQFRQRINQESPFLALTPENTGAALDPCRLVIDTLHAGIPGYEADALLQQENIYIEMSDEQYLVMILTCQDGEATFSRLWEALRSLPAREKMTVPPIGPPPAAIPRVSIRQAMLGPRSYMPLKDAEGQISAAIAAPYPPGIPILAPGEEIREKHIAYLQKKRYNIEEDIAVFDQLG